MTISGPCFATCAIAASAHAGLTGYAANSSFVGANGEYCQLDVYATFDRSSYWLSALFATNITLQGATFADVIQNDNGIAGSWDQQFTPAGSIDSFVTIGGEIGQPFPFNSTNADPMWGPQGFNQVGIPTGAGWFNGYPPNLQGTPSFVMLVDSNGVATFTGLATLAMRIVIPTELEYDASLSFATGTQYGQHLSFTYIADPWSGTFSFATVPAPAVTLVYLLAMPFALGARRRHGSAASPTISPK